MMMTQFIFLQEWSNRILSKAKILCVLYSHELLSTKYTTHQFTYFIYYSLQNKFKIQELQESNKYIKRYQQMKFEFLDKYYFYLYFI